MQTAETMPFFFLLLFGPGNEARSRASQAGKYDWLIVSVYLSTTATHSHNLAKEIH